MKHLVKCDRKVRAIILLLEIVFSPHIFILFFFYIYSIEVIEKLDFVMRNQCFSYSFVSHFFKCNFVTNDMNFRA